MLGAAGIDSAVNDAELIACSVLGVRRTELHLRARAEIDENSYRDIVTMVHLRADHRPLQHILGNTGFRTIELAVDERAMIPRPETELLAGAVIEHLQELAAINRLEEPVVVACVEESAANPIGFCGGGESGSRYLLVLELCTGSGAVAFSIATEVPRARVFACDISPEAIELARASCLNLGLRSRVRLLLGDLYAAIPDDFKGKFDVIVANPPYIPTAEIADLEPEVRDFEPRIALDGGADGLEVTRRILDEAGNWMRPGGLLALELAPLQLREVARLARRAGLVALHPGIDYLGVKRFFFAVAPECTPAELALDSVRRHDRVPVRGGHE